MIDAAPCKVDFLEAGSSGPVVMLVHSSASGARQWRRLMDELKDQFRVRAVNLFGYGETPPWPGNATQSLDDQAHLVEAALPRDADDRWVIHGDPRFPRLRKAGDQLGFCRPKVAP